MKYKIFNEETFLHFMTKLKDSLDSKQNSIGYSPVNKAGDTITGDLVILKSLKSQLSIYELGEKLEDKYGSKSVLDSTTNKVLNLEGQIAGLEITFAELGEVSKLDLPEINKTTTFLRGDGIWAKPTDTTYSAGVGLTLETNTFSAKAATASTLGSVIPGAGISIDAAGKISVSTNYVPGAHAGVVGNGGHIPAIGAAGQFLAHNGAWAVPKDTVYKGSANITLGAGNSFALSTVFMSLFENTQSLAISASDAVGTLKDLAWKSLPAGQSRSVFLDGSGSWSIPNDTKYTAGTGLALSGTTFSVKDEYVKKAGDTMTGALDMSNKNITRVSRLGVGTAAPSVAVDVVGDIRTNGELQFDNKEAYIQYNDTTNSLSFRFT